MQKVTILAGLQNTPGDPFFLQALGDTLESEKAWSELQEHFQQQLSALPSGSPIEAYAHYMLGKAAAELEDFQRALPHLERSVELHPQFPYSLHLLGRSYRQIGRFNEALDAHQRCSSLAPSFPWSWYEIGEVYLLLDQPSRAIPHLKTALGYQREQDPEHLDLFFKAIKKAESAHRLQQRRAIASELWPDRPPLESGQALEPIEELELSLFSLKLTLDQVEGRRNSRSINELSS